MSEAEGKTFTVEEANAALPEVVPLLEALRDAHARMDERADEVTETVPTNGGGVVHQEFLDASVASAHALRALDALGIVVRDPATGLIDFPTVRDGAEAFLCWRLGEGAIEWWHPADTGMAGRRRLDENE